VTEKKKATQNEVRGKRERGRKNEARSRGKG
jgi:hypothetical protein